MESCLYKGETTYAFTVEDDFYIEKELRKAGELDQLTCPGCSRPVMLRHGQIVRPYFAHRQDDFTRSCSYTEESMTHILGKELLYSYFKRLYPTVDIKFDYKLPIGRKPNLLCCFQDGSQLAVEFQKADLKVIDWEERNDSYRSNGINVLWVLNFMNHELVELKTYGFINFFKNMVLHDTDRSLLLLNVESKLVTVVRNVEYRVNGKSFDQGSISKDYLLDEIIIKQDGTVPCDLDEEYEKQYAELKSKIDKMFAEEEAGKQRLKAEIEAAQQRMLKADTDTAAKRILQTAVESVAASKLINESPGTTAVKISGKYSGDLFNDGKLRTTKKSYLQQLKLAAKNDPQKLQTLKDVYNQDEDKRDLIRTILQENPDIAAKLPDFCR